jgi:hypothetical protein
MGSGAGFSEQGTFFYKIFFNFNTSYGLLGSLLSSTSGKSTFQDVNTAWQYLTNNIEGDKFSERYKNILRQKRANLEKFGKILHFLTFECPWFFSEITGLTDILKYEFSEILKSERKQFTIKFNEDAVDMRVSTLFELYKDACFDYTNFKEVIPENLRMFDICIVLCAPPTYGLNIYAKSEDNITTSPVYGTTVFGGNAENAMSFKCLICKNCEIAYSDLVSFPDGLKNSEGTKFDSLEMKIYVDRVYSYTLNDELNAEILDSLIRQSTEDTDSNDTTPNSNVSTNTSNTVTTNTAVQESKPNNTDSKTNEKQTVENVKKEIKEQNPDLPAESVDAVINENPSIVKNTSRKGLINKIKNHAKTRRKPKK